MVKDRWSSLQVATGERLRSHVDELTAAWELECQSDPPLADPAGLILALADAISTSTDRDATLLREPAPSLHALSLTLVHSGTSLDVVVRQLGGLREVLYDHVIAKLPPAAAVDAQHQLNGAIDTLVEMCTSGATDNLERAALVDPLTGLWNRRALDRDLDRELALAERHQRCISVVVGDLDGLKAINDVLGHAAGDVALRALANALQSSLRAGDAAYRIGGDEFVVLLPGSRASDVPCLVARVTSAGAPAFGWGSATFPDDGPGPASLLDLADHRLLGSRRQNRVEGAPAAAHAEMTPAVRTRRRRRRPALAAGLLAMTFLGGAGLASAATGRLPGPAQAWAHDMLAKVGVSIPAGETEPDRTPQSGRPLRATRGDTTPGLPRAVDPPSTPVAAIGSGQLDPPDVAGDLPVVVAPTAPLNSGTRVPPAATDLPTRSGPGLPTAPIAESPALTPAPGTDRPATAPNADSDIAAAPVEPDDPRLTPVPPDELDAPPSPGVDVPEPNDADPPVPGETESPAPDGGVINPSPDPAPPKQRHVRWSWRNKVLDQADRVEQSA